MLLCWTTNPKSRLTFRELKIEFEKYHRNPYAYITCDKLKSDNNFDTPNTQVDQIKLINDMLGADDYFYLEAVNNYNEYKNEKVKNIARPS
uniref:Uncharacterized protein n=1 Tax=Acrobeloides nanus TaxID=290746 RepID=A0A914C3T5_9BILA